MDKTKIMIIILQNTSNRNDNKTNTHILSLSIFTHAQVLNNMYIYIISTSTCYLQESLVKLLFGGPFTPALCFRMLRVLLPPVDGSSPTFPSHANGYVKEYVPQNMTQNLVGYGDKGPEITIAPLSVSVVQ